MIWTILLRDLIKHPIVFEIDALIRQMMEVTQLLRSVAIEETAMYLV